MKCGAKSKSAWRAGAVWLLIGLASQAVAGGVPAPLDQPLPKEGKAAPEQEPEGPCTKADFETVVDEAAGALRDLNLKNKPEFQERLAQLKDKRGWSQDQFLVEAAPFVKDEQIEVYEAKSSALLDQISTMGQAGSAAKTPDCALLAELRANMSELVAAQTAKWAYMFDKLDKELWK